MKRFFYLILCSMVFSVCISAQNDIEKRASDILSSMTLPEKIGQMAQINIDVVCKPDASGNYYLDEKELRNAIVKYHVGSILNAPQTTAQTKKWWNKAVAKIQGIAMKETRIKIPVIYGLDQIHGATYTLGSTIFPQEVALAATFNPFYAKQMGIVSAYETRACNVPWVFSPVMDLGMDPRFPRQYEGFGEDPYLASVMGYQLVKGYEGDDNGVSGPFKVASCMKHFLGYSVPVSGKDRTPAYIPDQVLLEYHVPPFQAAVDAGVHTVMINSGIINNVPVHSNPKILNDLLRKRMGFKGVIVSDWEDINKLYSRDHLVSSIKEAIKTGINAGIDISMIPDDYPRFCSLLEELVNEGEVSVERINESVKRILELKLELGLFEKPYGHAENYPHFGCEKFRKASFDAACEAITLLKNRNNILPLKKRMRILVTGPNAVSRRALNGGWTFSWQGEKVDRFAPSCKTILQAVRDQFGKENVLYMSPE